MSGPARHQAALSDLADRLARKLAAPEPTDADPPEKAQSLAAGAAGTALLHIDRALRRAGSWRTAHRWVSAATADGVSAADTASLYLGAPAISFVLHTARADGTERYAAALAGLDRHVAALTHRRVDLALARMERGELPAFAEYDLFRGLTGIGAHLLRSDPGGAPLGRVLAYLVRLTQPLRADGEVLPGWWTFHDPRLRASVGGHANLGIAHGICGPLAVLSQAQRQQVIVDGQADAIATICIWLDRWQQDGETGPWWPQWIDRADLRAGRPRQSGPARPSWCYGTPGIARAQQLAGIVTLDSTRQLMAEHSLAACVSDDTQLGQIIDAGLCHGWAGLYQTVHHAAADACTPALDRLLPHLSTALVEHAAFSAERDGRLLDGDAGLALSLHTATATMPSVSQWDTCLLINRFDSQERMRSDETPRSGT